MGSWDCLEATKKKKIKIKGDQVPFLFMNYKIFALLVIAIFTILETMKKGAIVSYELL